jgi:tRNA (guanine-N7-)-methyltransferase
VTIPVEVATVTGCARLEDAGGAVLLARLVPGAAPWELEIGFGKGRFLLARAAERRDRRFLGLELAGEYFRLAARRLARRGLANAALVRGEALYLLAAVLPRAFARELHVYFPDPWPKSRHQRRRLFSPASVDLVLGALEPGGRLCFATDHLDYGAEVEAILAGCPGLTVARRSGGWEDGPRTNYEAKYVEEGRPILRLEAVLAGAPGLHPAGAREVLVACAVAGTGGAGDDAPGW